MTESTKTGQRELGIELLEAEQVEPAESRWPRLRQDRGASAVEYALLIAGIAAVIIVAVAFVGKTVSGQFSKVGSSIAATQ